MPLDPVTGPPFYTATHGSQVPGLRHPMTQKCGCGRCLLVKDEKRERAGLPRLVNKRGPPALAGLRKLMALESEALQLTAAELLMSVENVYHVKHWLEIIFDVMNNSGGSKLSTAVRMDETAKDTVEMICVEEVCVTSWSDILPHVLVKQLMIDNTKKIQDWGAALVVNRKGDSDTAMAVRLACLPPLLDLLYCGPHEQVGCLPIHDWRHLAL